MTKELDWMSADTALTCFEVLSRNSPLRTEGVSENKLVLSGLSVPCLSLSDCSHLRRNSHFFIDAARKIIFPEVLTS